MAKWLEHFMHDNDDSMAKKGAFRVASIIIIGIWAMQIGLWDDKMRKWNEHAVLLIML